MQQERQFSDSAAKLCMFLLNLLCLQGSCAKRQAPSSHAFVVSQTLTYKYLHVPAITS